LFKYVLCCFYANILLISLLYDLPDWICALGRAVKQVSPLSLELDLNPLALSQKMESCEHINNLPVPPIYSPLQSPKKLLNFEVVLMKMPETGFGIVIGSTTTGIVIKSKNTGLNMLSIIPENITTLQVGDHLLKINDEDVHEWSIAAIIEYIGNERIPVSGKARFSFSRTISTVGPNFWLYPDKYSSFTSRGFSRSFDSPRGATPREVC
jgi:hypothetical protein